MCVCAGPETHLSKLLSRTARELSLEKTFLFLERSIISPQPRNELNPKIVIAVCGASFYHSLMPCCNKWLR